jgi:hypothetical protein
MNEGYTEMAFGSGAWVGERRIFRFWAFFHPHGRVTTIEHPKTIGEAIEGSDPEKAFEAEYSEAEFTAYRELNHLNLSVRASIAKILA